MSLELGAELTRAPDASSAFLWGSCNIFALAMVLGACLFLVSRLRPYHDQHTPTAESALRAGPDANPPLNMRNALIFQDVLICAVSLLVFVLKGGQTRRERDEMDAGYSMQLHQRGVEGFTPDDGVEEFKEA